MAKELGYFDPDLMVGGRHDLLVEWMAYDRIEPMGEERMDLRFAMLTKRVVDMFAKRTTKLSDFMPDFSEKPEPTRENNLKIAETLSKLYGNNRRTGR